MVARILRSLRLVKGANRASLRECWLFQWIRAHSVLMNHLESEIAKDPQGLLSGPDGQAGMLRLAAWDIELGARHVEIGMLKLSSCMNPVGIHRFPSVN